MILRQNSDANGEDYICIKGINFLKTVQIEICNGGIRRQEVH